MAKLQQAFRILSIAITLLVWTAAGGAQLRQIAIIDVPGHPGFDSLVYAGNYLVMAHTSASNGVAVMGKFSPSCWRTTPPICGSCAIRSSNSLA